ncbi:bifunctional aspartokinase/homoserine dehydrogenase [Zea mays]|uniref:Homoserine dehydrogenase n=1 Tax=Zea mays TaxID=4577 RepID=B4G038_MAIZE|nr:bifunctional aspartokinase/homoserine dehydrogenase [Zea mays]ACF87731.1 unknown [Zea mays]ACR35486.1 unknown [Zea mays]AQK38825.1 Homoserine dehydrogenase [Zea mays]|eukprot:NP_001281196.1 bifunctional aspartokinase/homoserine dehydrogenase [Zea mays]
MPTPVKSVLPVVLLGCGGVGRYLLRHIVSCRPLHANQGVAIRVVGVADSSSLLVAEDVHSTGLDDALLTQLCAAKSAGSPLSSLLGRGHCQLFKNPEARGKVIDAATTLGRTTGLVLVDCSATYDTVSLLKDAVDHGCCVVLANKKPLTGAYEDFQKLVSNFRRIRFESTVGAGLPVIASVTRIIASGDPITRIVGSLSGTLGYVMSELEDGKKFSEVVKTAKSLGYTEPDPRDDLGGMDVARKALILARLLGQQISMESINVESLYPSELGPDAVSTKDFLESGLVQLDKSMEERIRAASSRGNVLRYVCEIESAGCQVGLKELPKDSALGRLRGSDNVVEIYSRCYQSSPLVIQGAGAGNDTTAAGVLADIIDLQDLFQTMA